jgi:hypothetical protein
MLAGVGLQALVITLLLGGLMANTALGLLCWIIVTAILIARIELVPRVPVWPTLVRRVPLLLRIGVCVVASYVMTSVIVEPAVKRSETSFSPLLVTVLASLVVAALLLPGPPPGTSRTGTATDDGRAHTPPPPDPASARPTNARSRHRTVPAVIGLITAIILLDTTPAYADNCGGLTDCSVGVKIALVAAGIALVVLVVVLAPEVIAGAAAAEAEIGAEIVGEEIFADTAIEAIGEEALADVAAEAALGSEVAAVAGSELAITATEAGFSVEEAGIIAEAHGILESAEMAQIVEAHAAGESTVVEIAGRIIQYEPGLPASGMTMFGENGFLIGNEAFASNGELAKTVLHELYRLGTSVAPEAGISGSTVASETEAAFTFASRAYEFLKGLTL